MSQTLSLLLGQLREARDRVRRSAARLTNFGEGESILGIAGDIASAGGLLDGVVFGLQRVAAKPTTVDLAIVVLGDDPPDSAGATADRVPDEPSDDAIAEAALFAAVEDVARGTASVEPLRPVPGDKVVVRGSTRPYVYELTRYTGERTAEVKDANRCHHSRGISDLVVVPVETPLGLQPAPEPPHPWLAHCSWCEARVHRISFTAGQEVWVAEHEPTCPKSPVRPLVEALREAWKWLDDIAVTSHTRASLLALMRKALEPYRDTPAADRPEPIPPEAGPALDAAIAHPLYRAGDPVRAARDIAVKPGPIIKAGSPGEVVRLSNNGVLIEVRFDGQCTCLVRPDEIGPVAARSTKCPHCNAVGCQCNCDDCDTARAYPADDSPLRDLPSDEPAAEDLGHPYRAGDRVEVTRIDDHDAISEVRVGCEYQVERVLSRNSTPCPVFIKTPRRSHHPVCLDQIRPAPEPAKAVDELLYRKGDRVRVRAIDRHDACVGLTVGAEVEVVRECERGDRYVYVERQPRQNDSSDYWPTHVGNVALVEPEPAHEAQVVS